MPMQISKTYAIKVSNELEFILPQLTRQIGLFRTTYSPQTHMKSLSRLKWLLVLALYKMQDQRSLRKISQTMVQVGPLKFQLFKLVDSTVPFLMFRRKLALSLFRASHSPNILIFSAYKQKFPFLSPRQYSFITASFPKSQLNGDVLHKFLSEVRKLLNRMEKDNEKISKKSKVDNHTFQIRNSVF